jgi:hypothetical protein
MKATASRFELEQEAIRLMLNQMRRCHSVNPVGKSARAINPHLARIEDALNGMGYKGRDCWQIINDCRDMAELLYLAETA